MHQFIAALRAGRVCLHPTDTVPGLTFDPTMARGQQALLALKGRPESKPLLALVATPEQAKRFFAPLPGEWEQLLASLWPAALSVVWRASSLAPKVLVASDGTIGLRVPRLPVAAAWFQDILERLDMPLPTTSVNRSGDPAITDFAAAAAFLRSEADGYVPAWDHGTLPTTGKSSTVIRLHEDGTFSLLRQGAIGIDHLQPLQRPEPSSSVEKSSICR